MQTDILSDIELYYSYNFTDEIVILDKEEYHHSVNVMRNKVGDKIFITNGKGTIAKTVIESISKKELVARIIESKFFLQKNSNIVFCIPHLKKIERLEFALEKCVELGINNFIIYDSERAIAKGNKIQRWEKILISAMKQSLNSWLPAVGYKQNFYELILLEGNKYIFDQSAEKDFQLLIDIDVENKNYFIFGPEGGFSEKEYELINDENKIRLTENRLRSETAIITAASFLLFKATQ
ncbi:MAG: 16S rRNA (uracil(1498)-N(3))-methyltransferase [Melioribacteraceae bacterium]|nr:16S rRNA (uracil(1498)-N(3))-methyltransferase [Melioribacteraceae bacterium]